MRLLCNEWPPGTGKKSIHNLHDSEKLIQKTPPAEPRAAWVTDMQVRLRPSGGLAGSRVLAMRAILHEV